MMFLAALSFAGLPLQLAAALPVTEQQAPVPAARQVEPESIWTAGQGGASATDTQRGWDLAVSERGLRVRPLESSKDAEEHEWSFEIGTATFGRMGAAQALTLGQPAARGERVDLDHGSLSEWFVRGEHGVEHGWMIPAAPEGDESKPLWIGLRIEGDLSMHIVDDGSGAFLRDARGVLRLRYVGLKAFDANGAVLPSQLMASPFGVGVRIDAHGARYPLSVDPIVQTPPWHFETDQAGAGFSWLMGKPAGDVNGDGYTDVLIGGQNYTGPNGAGEGRVSVYHGGPSGPAPHTSPDWYVDGGIAGGLLGIWVSPAGDVNGDGYDDIAVIASSHGNGKVYIWLGSASGLGPTGLTATSADFTYEDSSPALGWMKVEEAGDVNRDGYDDFVVGYPFQTVGISSEAGRVRLFFGSASGPLATPWVQNGTEAGAHFGWDVSTAGDVNADSYSDLIVGEPHRDNSGVDKGSIHVFHGGVGFAADHNPELYVANGGFDNSRYGYRVHTAGDFNGDGFADAVVGMPWGNGGQTEEGEVYVYYGGSNGLTPSPTNRLNGGSPAYFLGGEVSSAGDVDGDGFSDLLASHWTGNLFTGGVWITYGRPTPLGAPGIPGQDHLGSPQAASFFAENAAGGGDVNGDGFGDVLVAANGWDGGQVDEGAIFLYFGSPSPQGGYAPALVEPGPLSIGTSSSRTGRSVSSAGDVNADGFNDIVIGSPEFGATDNGRVQVYLGSADGPNLASPFWTFDSANTGERFGWSVSAGDIDNDGKSDIVVGAPNYSNGQSDEGRVYLFKSSGVSIAATPTWTFESNEAGALFGNAVSALGDVNADGFSDIAVGAPGASSGQGSVRLFHGRATGLASLTSAITITSGIAGSEFGTSLALAGDVNLDGFGDLAVGAPKIDNPQVDEGRVYVYLGSYAGITGVVGDDEESDQTGALLGSSIAQCGDVNGDGRAEILVGAPGYNAGTTGGGTFLYTASGGAVITLATQSLREGAQPNSQYGFAVSAGGDVNGDGWNDVLVGAPDFDGGFANQGRVYLYLGSSSGLAASPSETYDGPVANARFGESIALGGDVNGDGLSDPIGGVPSLNGGDGAVLIFSASGNTAWRVSGTQRQVSDTQALQLLGRASETNQFQINLGVQNAAGNTATAMGRAPVKLEWEIQPVGTTLNGSAIQDQVSFVDSGSFGSGLRLSRNITGLASGTAYHWRARTVVRNPYYPHTRWTTIQLDGLQEKKLGLSADCNQNGIGDPLDIQSAFSFDCNGNTIPDECDITALTSLDCNADIVPDECELVLNDCNNNLIPDDCDTDCNGNFAPDECDIANLISIDSNGDLVPDECQTASMNLAHFCFGDGTGAACPCANSSPVGNEEGCLSSLAVGGRLRAVGIARVLAPYDNFTLVGTQMPNSSALYFQGTAQQSTGNGSPFGDGKRCASGSILRLGTKINSGNTSQYPVLGDQPISIRGALPAPGGTRYYQGWYRNAAAFCTANTFNLTNGLRVTWIP